MDTAERETDDQVPATLSRGAFAVSLVIVLALFLVLNPVWEPRTMTEMDENILWSYVPIPFLVLAFLARERKLTRTTWFLETMKLTAVKFFLTYVAAHVIWTLLGAPGIESTAPEPNETRVEGRFAPREAPPATKIEADITGGLRGHVIDATGAPVANAVVRIADGLDDTTFAPPAATATIVHDGADFSPALSIVHIYQRVVLRATHDELHTANVIDADGRPLFNYPLIPSTEREFMFEHGHGVVTITCRVHGDLDPMARVVVVGNPFARITGEDGSFAFDGVPRGALVLEAWTPDATTRRDVDLAAGATVEIELTLD